LIHCGGGGGGGGGGACASTACRAFARLPRCSACRALAAGATASVGAVMIPYRRTESYYVIPRPDQITIIFVIEFEDTTDRALARNISQVRRPPAPAVPLLCLCSLACHAWGALLNHRSVPVARPHMRLLCVSCAILSCRSCWTTSQRLGVRPTFRFPAACPWSCRWRERHPWPSPARLRASLASVRGARNYAA
jgi:hypothetical protein